MELLLALSLQDAFVWNQEPNSLDRSKLLGANWGKMPAFELLHIMADVIHMQDLHRSLEWFLLIDLAN